MKRMKELTQSRIFWSVPLVLLAGSLSQPASASWSDQLFGRRASLDMYNIIDFENRRDCRQGQEGGPLADACSGRQDRIRKQQSSYELLSTHTLAFESGLADVAHGLALGFSLVGTATADIARDNAMPRNGDSVNYNPSYRFRQKDCVVNSNGRKTCFGDLDGWARLRAYQVNAQVGADRFRRVNLVAGVGDHGSTLHMLKSDNYRTTTNPKTYRGISGEGSFDDYRYGFAIVDRYLQGQMNSPHKLSLGSYHDNDLYEIPYYATFGVRRNFDEGNRVEMKVGHVADYLTSFAFKGVRIFEFGDTTFRITPTIEHSRLGGKNRDKAREEGVVGGARRRHGEYYTLRFFHENTYMRNTLSFSYAGGDTNYDSGAARVSTRREGFGSDAGGQNFRKVGTRGAIIANRFYLVQDFFPASFNEWFVRLDARRAWYREDAYDYRNDSDSFTGTKGIEATTYIAGIGYDGSNGWSGQLRVHYGYDHDDWYDPDTEAWYGILKEKETKFVGQLTYNVRSGRYRGARFRINMNHTRAGRVQAGYYGMNQRDLDRRVISANIRLPISIL